MKIKWKDNRADLCPRKVLTSQFTKRSRLTQSQSQSPRRHRETFGIMLTLQNKVWERKCKVQWDPYTELMRRECWKLLARWREEPGPYIVKVCCLFIIPGRIKVVVSFLILPFVYHSWPLLVAFLFFAMLWITILGSWNISIIEMYDIDRSWMPYRELCDVNAMGMMHMLIQISPF